MKLSVIIVNWNAKSLLDQSLSSVYSCITENFPLEVFVVDNGSSDGSPGMVKEKFPAVKLIENRKNLGFARANNQAIVKSSGKYVLLLNSDVIVLDKALEKTVTFLESHPEAGAVGCKLLNQDGTLQHSCYNFGSLTRSVISSLGLDQTIFRNISKFQSLLKDWSHDKVREVDYVRGAFLMLRKKSIEHVGLLDERFFMYAEEADICYRLKKAGWKVYFFPGAEVIHLRGRSSNSIGLRAQSQRLLSRILFFRKWHGLLYCSIHRVLIVILALLRMALSPFKSLAHSSDFYSFKQEIKIQLVKIMTMLTLKSQG